MISAKTDSRN